MTMILVAFAALTAFAVVKMALRAFRRLLDKHIYSAARRRLRHPNDVPSSDGRARSAEIQANAQADRLRAGKAATEALVADMQRLREQQRVGG